MEDPSFADISGCVYNTPVVDGAGAPIAQEGPILSELYAARQRRRSSIRSIPGGALVNDTSAPAESTTTTSEPAPAPAPAPVPAPAPITIREAEIRLRQSVNVYIQARNNAKAPYDPSVPRIRGMWIMSPTGDGRTLRDNEAGSMLEVASDIEVRETASDCPWPYWVYKNHVEREIAKGEECPIKGVPLSSSLIVSVSMNCGHVFDHAAIVAWASRKPDVSCPICRTPIAGLWHVRSKK